jgi:hypothetical protein
MNFNITKQTEIITFTFLEMITDSTYSVSIRVISYKSLHSYYSTYAMFGDLLSETSLEEKSLLTYQTHGTFES